MRKPLSIKKLVYMVPVVILLSCFQNCSPMESGLGQNDNSSEGIDPAAYQALEDQVITTMSNRCVACHSSVLGGSNLPYLNNMDDIKLEQIYVKRGSPETSALYIAIINGDMPKGGPDLNVTAPAEVVALRNWIQYMP